MDTYLCTWFVNIGMPHYALPIVIVIMLGITPELSIWLAKI